MGAGRVQLDLFGPPKAAGVGALTPPPELLELASRMPELLRLGTSSWSFPGWRGLVYDRAASEGVLARQGLGAYAAHPLLRTVGVDRSHYAPLAESDWRAYAEAVPPPFRFVAKAHDACTLYRFPKHARFGERRGQENPYFLDPSYATDVVVGPYLAGLGAHAGPLLFQLAPQSVDDLGGERFGERLLEFLSALPRGGQYAVEVRNRELLSPAYAQALAEASAVHCINVWADMPGALTQAEHLGVLSGKLVLVRWMLPRHLAYEAAKERYEPFDQLVDEAPEVRADIATLVIEAVARGLPVYVIINNKAEGSAPLSVLELARLIARARA